MAIHANGVGTTGKPVRRSWSSKDAILYALGVGAGIEDLKFTTENTIGKPQRVLPTFAVIVGTRGLPPTLGSFDPAKELHGGQGFQLLGEIPTEGEIETVGKIAGDELTTSTWVDTNKAIFRTMNQKNEIVLDQES
jgi:hypothetical protein